MPGLVFLSAQFAVTVFEMTQHTQDLAWAPHSTQIQYHITAFKNGQLLPHEAYAANYGIGPDGWEHHKIGNLIRLIEKAEANKNTHPDSVLLRYSVNGHHEQIHRWTYSK